MRKWRLSFSDIRPSYLLRLLVALALIAVLGAFLFAWSGLYSAAASRGHWALTNWFLHFGLRNSVETHSLAIQAPELKDPALIRLGAGHFDSGCAICHGAPGKQSSAVFDQMLPKPPPLADAVRKWEAAELFWIVKNGFKFTGMPGWPAQQRDDEVWAVVAFLQSLPELHPAQYRALIGLSGESAARPASRLQVCASCHGDHGDYPPSPLIPVLQGQREEYLARALHEYRAGARQSGVMQHFASTLDDTEIAQLARHYATHPALPRRAMSSSEQVQRGRAIAESGIPEAGIPACLSCHDRPATPLFPRLAGQNARFITGQLTLWKDGLRRQTAPGQIMAVIASRLSPQAARDVAAYFEQHQSGGERAQ